MHESIPENATRRRLVVVDDDELMRETLETYFSRHGFDVTGFGDGPSALDHLTTENSVDLVVYDWRMSPMSGIEPPRRLRAAGTDIPVVFLTGPTDRLHQEAALDDGAVDFAEQSRGTERDRPTVSRAIRPGARRGFRRRRGIGRLSRQRAQVHQAHPPEVSGGRRGI